MPRIKDWNRTIADRRTAALLSLRDVISHTSDSDHRLISRLTRVNKTRTHYDGNPRGDLFVHWWYRDRKADRLTVCEIFHLNMLLYFNAVDRVDTIHIRCACSGDSITDAMSSAVKMLSCGNAIIDFKIVRQNSGWEHDTFKEATEYAVTTGKYVYYTHFKGVSRIYDPILGNVPRFVCRSTDLDIYYWCYLMYKALFQAPEGSKAIGPLLHLGMNSSYRNRDIAWSHLCKGDEVFHYCGSFQAFSGDYIKECLVACGLGDRSVRESTLWVGDPYTVEMFLSMVALKDDVYSLDVPYQATSGIYTAYTHNSIPQYVDGFRNLYL